MVENVNHYQDHLEFNKATIATEREKKIYCRRQEVTKKRGKAGERDVREREREIDSNGKRNENQTE